MMANLFYVGRKVSFCFTLKVLRLKNVLRMKHLPFSSNKWFLFEIEFCWLIKVSFDAESVKYSSHWNEKRRKNISTIEDIKQWCVLRIFVMSEFAFSQENLQKCQLCMAHFVPENFLSLLAWDSNDSSVNVWKFRVNYHGKMNWSFSKEQKISF